MSDGSEAKDLLLDGTNQESGEDNLFDHAVDTSDFGKPDSLRYNILTWTLNEKYDHAIDELNKYIDNDSPYPNFKDKVGRFVQHAVDLIYAIKAKRSFPGINSLTRAKQQELREKFKDHFKELKVMMAKIEKIQGDLRVSDARSTIIVIKTVWYALFAIALTALWADLQGGLADTAVEVTDDLFNGVSYFVAKILGL